MDVWSKAGALPSYCHRVRAEADEADNHRQIGLSACGPTT